MPAWLPPTLLYVLLLGFLGVTSKLALRTLDWPVLILWSGLGYIGVATVLVLAKPSRLSFAPNTGWAIVTACIAVSSLIVFYVALNLGEARKIIPITAAYPAVTLIVAQLVLGESATLVNWAGVVLVIGGVILITAGG